MAYGLILTMSLIFHGNTYLCQNKKMGKFFFLISCCLWVLTTAYAQNGTPTVDNDDKVYTIVDVLPKFPNGDLALLKYANSVGYPAHAYQNKMQGTVYIQFVINTTGNAEDLKVMRSSGYNYLDSISMAHLAKMPTWTPGVKDGKNVKVNFTIPIKFVWEEKPPLEEGVFVTVTDYPTFPGGADALDKYLEATAPSDYTPQQLKGKYTEIEVIIDENGAPTNKKVAQSSGDNKLDEAALAHIQSMPNWNPGMNNGEKVKVKIILAIGFAKANK